MGIQAALREELRIVSSRIRKHRSKARVALRVRILGILEEICGVLVDPAEPVLIVDTAAAIAVIQPVEIVDPVLPVVDLGAIGCLVSSARHFYHEINGALKLKKL